MHNHISSWILTTALWVANIITPNKKTEKKLSDLLWTEKLYIYFFNQEPWELNLSVKNQTVNQGVTD